MTSTMSHATEENSADHGHEAHADHRMFGLATFLVADAMTFAGFFAAYLTFKAVNPLPRETSSSWSYRCPSSTPCFYW